MYTCAQQQQQQSPEFAAATYFLSPLRVWLLLRSGLLSSSAQLRTVAAGCSIRTDGFHSALPCQVLVPLSQPDLDALKRSKSSKSLTLYNEEAVVVDVRQLHKRTVDPALRRALLDEALETQEQDNEELLRKYRARLDRCLSQLSGYRLS